MGTKRFKRFAWKELQLLALLLAAMLMASCNSVDDEDEDDVAEEEVDRFEFLHRNEQEIQRESYEDMSSERVVEPGRPAKSKEALEKKDKKISALNRKTEAAPPVKKLPPVTDPHFYDDFTALNGDEEIPVSLIFNNAPLLDTLSAFADVLGFNFIADPNLKNYSVTINLNSNMTRRELWSSFERMLTMAGASVIPEGSLLRIMQRSQLHSQGDRSVGPGNHAIYYRQLRNATSKEVVAQLRNFISSSALVVDLTKPNAILVSDEPSNMAKLRQIIEYLDENPKSKWPRAVINCKNILPSKLSFELYEILPVLGFNVARTTDRNEQPGTVQLVGVDRLQMLVVSAASEEMLDQIREWVNLLDTSDSDKQERVFVYKVRHNKALYLTYALSAIYETQASSLSIDTSTGKKRIENINSPNSRRNTTTQVNATNRNSRSSTVNDFTNAQTDYDSSIFSSPVKVFADGVLNRLVIRTTPRTYASIKALLDRLDVVPAQVLLQVMIIEVTLNEATQFGLEFSGNGGNDNVDLLYGTNYSGSGLNPFTATTNPETGKTTYSLSTGSQRQDGSTFVISDPNDPQKRFGYIRAMAGNGLVKMISCPQLLVTSHTEASINVGQKIPLLSSNYSNTQSSGTTQNSYVYTDTGIILTVTPQVTSTDLISLDIKQEMSLADTNNTSKIDSPTIRQRTIQTAMTIANGQTMILGGLIQENKEDSLQSLPFINKVPVLNRLVGNTDANIERTEVLVMITGYIINERSRLEDLIQRYNDAIEAINDFDSKLGDGPNADKHKPDLLTNKDFWM